MSAHLSIGRMVLREIGRRKLNFALSLISVMVAAACLSGASTLLSAHEVRTQEIMSLKEAELKKAMAELEDDYRIITKKMGFNILILPKDQDLGEFYSESYASKFMPENYVNLLAASEIITIQHLLPSLQQKIKWEEQKRTILLTGIRDEVPIANRDPKKPLLQPIPPSGMILGHELHQSIGVEVGDKLELMGREFEVSELYPERGNVDDITVWINLDESQEMLDKKDLVNGILALECSCALADLPKIRTEIEAILPDTQVIEKASEALARAETRYRAAEEAKASVKREKKGREDLRKEREALASILVPLVITLCGVWVGLLAWTNVRERRDEIGILRAVGFRSSQIMVLFIGRAVAVGSLGGLIGYVAGWGVGAAWSGLAGDQFVALFAPALFVSTAVLAPVVSALAGWLPAQVAAQQDPAEILGAE